MSIPRIQYPIKLQNAALRRIKFNPKYLEREKLKTLPLLIQCKYFPHRLNQSYDKFKAIPLSSGTWNSRKSIGRQFTFLPFAPHSASNWWKAKNISPPPSFSQYSLHPFLNSSLSHHDYIRPTNIQHKAIPTILAGDDCLIASETGNGKTLAYLIPLLHRLLSSDVTLESSLSFNSPRILIVTPSRELALQIYKLTQSLVEDSHLQVECILGGNIPTKFLHGERKKIDVLVGTLGAVYKGFIHKFYSSKALLSLVFDETDTLLDDTFKQRSLSLLQRVTAFSSMSKRPPTQLLFIGATFPSQVHKVFSGTLDTEQLTTITTEDLHRIPKHVYQKFIRTPKTERLQILIQEIQSDVLKKRPIIIFSNKSSTADWISLSLNENNIPTINLTQNIHYSNRHEFLEKFKSGVVNVLSSTDLASRGLDLPNVRAIFNYDFPLNMSDYIHRVGRIGRAGSRHLGKVTNFISNQLQVDLVQKIEMALRKNTPIPQVHSNIIRIIRDSQKEKLEEEEENEFETLE